MAPQAPAVPRSLVLLSALAGVAACECCGIGTAAQAAESLPPASMIESVPLGDVAGAAAAQFVNRIDNPYKGQPQAVQEGKRLFIKMNCADCHGYDAKGGMGPDLTDTYWRYGGTPVQVYKSIHDGRPQGMPAWGYALPPQDIWKLVAYIQSLGGMFPPDFYHPAMQGDKPPGEAEQSNAPGGQSPNGQSSTPGSPR